jgi:photosystem II CP47 chlorophyll apoprotein
MGNIETVLSSSISAVFLLLLSLQVQCGMVLQQPELFGPTRYQWDSGYSNKKLNDKLKHQ